MNGLFVQAKGLPPGHKSWLNGSLANVAAKRSPVHVFPYSAPTAAAGASAAVAAAAAAAILSTRRSRRDKASSPLPMAPAAAIPTAAAAAVVTAGPVAEDRAPRLADWKSVGGGAVRATAERSVFGRTGLCRNGTVRPPDGFDFGSTCFVCNLEGSALLFCDYSGCARRYHQVRGHRFLYLTRCVVITVSCTHFPLAHTAGLRAEDISGGLICGIHDRQRGARSSLVGVSRAFLCAVRGLQQ